MRLWMKTNQTKPEAMAAALGLPAPRSCVRQCMVLALVVAMAVLPGCLGASAGVAAQGPKADGGAPAASGAGHAAAAQSPAPAGPLGDLEKRFKLQGVRQYFVKNERLGPLLVVEGRVVNSSKEPVDLVEVEATLFGEGGAVLTVKRAMAGVTVALSQLETFLEPDIEALLNDEAGILTTNRNVGQGDSVPFMVVFFTPPGGVNEFAVKVVAAQPAE